MFGCALRYQNQKMLDNILDNLLKKRSTYQPSNQPVVHLCEIGTISKKKKEKGKETNKFLAHSAIFRDMVTLTDVCHMQFVIQLEGKEWAIDCCRY